MLSLLAYKGIIAILLVGVAGTSGVATYYYQQQSLKVSQSSDLNNQVNQLEGQIVALKEQIDGLNKEIDSLNSQISQLQNLNAQLSGNNGQLITQIGQLQSQVTQLQSQVAQFQSEIGDLQTRLTDLIQKLNLQQSRVIANSVCIYSDCPSGNGGNQIGNLNFVNLGSIPFSGYVRVSWTGAHVSFSVQVFDVNVTTPASASGVFSLPVSANSTGNAWFTGYDCQPIPSGTFCPPLTYSMTYWY